MTNQEFSNSFTTLLNSYNTQAQFGEESSKADISLDEYEKSVLLTQAQDLIVKSYFNRNFNQQGEGFDDSTRRQVDFSSLIRVAKLEPTDSNMLYDSRGVVFKMPRKVSHGHIVEGTTDVLFILNEKLIVEKTLIEGKGKTWIVNNYSNNSAVVTNSNSNNIKTNDSDNINSNDSDDIDGIRTIYYTEPVVEYFDRSIYYLIEGYNVKLFKHPGIPVFHEGHDKYWIIEDDPIRKKYNTQPTFSTIEGHADRWFINDGTKPYYREPHSTQVITNDPFYTIDIDERIPKVHYRENPGDATYHPAVEHHWYVNDYTNIKYYEEIESSGPHEDVYYYIDLDDPRIKYQNSPGDAITKWDIYFNGNLYDTSDTNPEITHHPSVPGVWRVYNNEKEINVNFNPKKEGEIKHNVVQYYTIDNLTGEGVHYDEYPLTEITDQWYFVDTETRNMGNPHFKNYYLGTEMPTVEYKGNGDNPHVFESLPEEGWYIINSNYGDWVGPFDYMPTLSQVQKPITYWLIDNDITNPYFKEDFGDDGAPMVTPHVSYQNWELWDNNGKLIMIFEKNEPSVDLEVVPQLETWSITYMKNSTEISHGFNFEPTVQQIWYFENISTIYTQQPSVEEVTSGEYYTIVYKYDGDGHQAGDVVDDNVYEEEEPTIHEVLAANEYWAYFEGTDDEIKFNSEPHIEYTEQLIYYEVDVEPGIRYDKVPSFRKEDAVPIKFKIDIDGRELDFQPVIIPVDPVASCWVFDGIDKEFCTTNRPKVDQITDTSEGAKGYNVNGVFFGTNEPKFNIIEGIDPKKSIEEYVIVPISYREYDREMSKPYAQPLKKQAWRLFQNNSTGFDFDSELIPKFNIRQQILDAEKPGFNKGDVQLFYKIRYIRRPRPIILEDLPNGLEIDGENEESSCELNPIIHIDILTKAVELALATRSKAQPQQGEQRERER